MRPARSFIGQPIRSLQTMLRTLARNDDSDIRVIPDGIYGPETMQAVTAFQKKHGLPATGVADQDTWDAITAAYEPALIELGPAQPLQIVLDPGQVIRRSQRHPHIFLLQGLLAALADSYENLIAPELTGVLDNATADALALVQLLSGLPMTGELDKQTWRQLALQYPLATATD